MPRDCKIPDVVGIDRVERRITLAKIRTPVGMPFAGGYRVACFRTGRDIPGCGRRRIDRAGNIVRVLSGRGYADGRGEEDRDGKRKTGATPERRRAVAIAWYERARDPRHDEPKPHEHNDVATRCERPPVEADFGVGPGERADDDEGIDEKRRRAAEEEKDAS